MLELKIENLTKNYKDKKAVDNVSVMMKPGIYGLLGANGAGKTTLLRMLCGVVEPTSGGVYFNNLPIHQCGRSYRNELGYLPQELGFYPDFTGFRFLRYVSSLKGLPPERARIKIQELLEEVGLQDAAHKKIKTYSGGMRQRLGIVQALLNDPGILVVDEPTAGLDPKERIRFRNLISNYAADKIVVYSTHIVSDVEYIANEILLMQEGRLLLQGSPSKMLLNITGMVWEADVNPDKVAQIQSRYMISSIKNKNSQVRVRFLSESCPPFPAQEVYPGLEDLYLYYFQEHSVQP